MPRYARPCFEPVRKGSYGIDAESGFAENRSCSAGLTPQAVDEKGKCTLSLLRRKRKIDVGCGGKFGIKIGLGIIQKCCKPFKTLKFIKNVVKRKKLEFRILIRNYLFFGT